MIALNAFDMACVGHVNHGLWTHPRDTSRNYTSLSHWLDLARLLERGLFDGLFLADVLGIYDVLDGRPDAAIRNAVQVPLLDPAMLVPAMATVTTHLGFGITSNLSYEAPYLFARRMSTLDHLTQGRIGWNIVTGYLDSAARAMGLDAQQKHDDRYDLADEYMQVVTRLWEESWEADAIVAAGGASSVAAGGASSVADGIYADPARVHHVRHQGPQYRLDAPHLVAPSPQRTPVLYQAGASARGLAFAARHAECVFMNGGPSAGPAIARLRKLGGRPKRVFVGATLILGRTDAEAADKLADYRAHSSTEGALAHAAASLGLDFNRFAPDEPIITESNAIQSNVDAMARAMGGVLTRRGLTDQFILGSRQKPIVGSVERVAETLIAFAAESGCDGFNLSRTVFPECLTDVVDMLVPALQERGAYKTAYSPGTYREKLFGPGARYSTSSSSPSGLPGTT